MNGVNRTGVARGSAGLFWLAFGLFAQPAAGEDLTAEVMKQARARQEKVKTLEVKLKRTETHEPGSMAKGNKVFPPRPKERTTLTSEFRLWVRGNNFRVEDDRPRWFADTGIFHPQTRTSLSDGAVVKTLYPKGIWREEIPMGRIAKQDSWTGDEAWPLLLAFQGATLPGAADNLRKSKPSDNAELISGVPCRRFDCFYPWGTLLEAFWIDEDGLVRRTTRGEKDQPRSQTDVRYERRYGFDSFPVSWTTRHSSKTGAVQSERTVEVVEAKINQPIADSLFELRFPPGCIVTDEEQRKHYVVQPDGSMAERDPPKAEAAPKTEGGSLSRYRGPIAVCLGAILVVVVAGCLTRLRRRKPKANPPPNVT